MPLRWLLLMRKGRAMSEDLDGLALVVDLCERAEYFARVAECPGTIAPEGCADWLRWLAQTLRDRAGITPPQ